MSIYESITYGITSMITEFGPYNAVTNRSRTISARYGESADIDWPTALAAISAAVGPLGWEVSRFEFKQYEDLPERDGCIEVNPTAETYAKAKAAFDAEHVPA